MWPANVGQRSPLGSVLGVVCMSLAMGITLGVLLGPTSASTALHTTNRPSLLKSPIRHILPPAPSAPNPCPSSSVNCRVGVFEPLVTKHTTGCSSATTTTPVAPVRLSWLQAAGWGTVAAGFFFFVGALFRKSRQPPAPQDQLLLCTMGGTKQGFGGAAGGPAVLYTPTTGNATGVTGEKVCVHACILKTSWALVCTRRHPSCVHPCAVHAHAYSICATLYVVCRILSRYSPLHSLCTHASLHAFLVHHTPHPTVIHMHALCVISCEHSLD